MEYDFKNAPDRSHTDSVKWDVKPGELPMWIANMDFKTAPEIIKAMKEKVSLGVFGYEWPQADYFNAVADWYEIEHGYRPQTNWMICCARDFIDCAACFAYWRYCSSSRTCSQYFSYLYFE